MIGRKPEGYKDLLAYQKAASVQELTLGLTNLFPKTKNMLNLKDQMDRSARSGTKNIIEGWKRNTTNEYFTFLGFSIGALEELKDDCADIAKGLYQELMGIKGLMGGMGKPLAPLQPFSPLSSPKPITPLQPFTESDLTNLRFYPLDPSLPPIIQLYLKCKETLMLLNKLQKSLDHKMDEDRTRPVSEMARRRIKDFEDENHKVMQEIEKMGLIRLEDGRFVTREEWEKRVKGD